ncbi:MAG TPA: recombinase family protein [Streptosporangiaceae bacterium]|nr:recombinase family protein [Streptosporangiaceae bacterium]
MKELLVLLEDELHARQVNLEILTGICAGFHRPNGQTIADKMLFMVAAMAAEMERDLIQERTLDGLAAAAAKSRRGGRPTAVDADTLARPRTPSPRRIHHRHRRPPGHRPIHPLPRPHPRHHRLTGAESAGHSTERGQEPSPSITQSYFALGRTDPSGGPDSRAGPGLSGRCGRWWPPWC